MVSAFFPSANDRKLIPEGRGISPMPWVIAIMVFLTIIAVASGLALRAAAIQVRSDLAGRVTVQIVEADTGRREAQTALAVSILQRQPIVAQVKPVAPARVKAMIEPWLGADGVNEDIPLPGLIDLDLTRSASTASLERLRAVLADTVPGARVDAHGRWLRPVFDLLRTLQYLALGVVVLLGFATTAVVILAARGSLKSHGDTIEILHLLGATDVQVARLFQRRIALDALLGGVAGLALAVIVLIVLAGEANRLGSGLVDSVALGWKDWIVVAAVPLTAGLVSLVTARRTVLYALKRRL